MAVAPPLPPANGSAHSKMPSSERVPKGHAEPGTALPVAEEGIRAKVTARRYAHHGYGSIRPRAAASLDLRFISPGYPAAARSSARSLCRHTVPAYGYRRTARVRRIRRVTPAEPSLKLVAVRSSDGPSDDSFSVGYYINPHAIKSRCLDEWPHR